MSVISHEFETGCGEQGFTLLELLVVVLLMSAMAWMALGIVTDNTSQIRFEDTRNRLAAIRQAVAGNIQPSAPENGMPSSFVTDNGRLPDNIDSIVFRPASNWDGFKLVEPVFDPTPGAGGVSDESGDEINLTQPEQKLPKGHRGAYLNGVPVGGKYRDGWGTDRSASATITECPSVPGSPATFSDDDNNNHGWCVTSYNEGFYVDSYGMDGVDGDLTGSEYEFDMAMSPPVLRDDWTVDISGSKVKIINLKSIPVPEELGVSLLVYVNGNGEDSPKSWRRITSGTVTGFDAHDPSDSSIGVAEVSFPTGTRIPVGEHLLVLFLRDPGTPEIPGTPPIPAVPCAPDSPILTAITTSSVYVTARVRFLPRGGIPEMKLVIR